MKARVKAIIPVKKPRARLVCMTGTPISETPENAYSLVRLIEPELAVSPGKFNSAFIETEEKFYGGQKTLKIKGYRQLDRLRELMSRISIRRTMAEVSGMPPKIWTERHVELSDVQRRAYNIVAKKTQEDRSNEGDLGSKTLRLRQILCDPEILGIEAPSAKFDALEDLADEVLADPVAKMVVWMSYITPMSKLLKRFKQYNPVAIFEETKPAELTRLQKTFDHSDERLVFATPQKGGTGLDWLNRARVAVYLDLPWSFTLFQQSQDRLIRRTDITSQDWLEKLKGSPATLIKLRVPGSVDDLVESILDRKLSLVDGTDASIEKLRLTQAELLSFIQELK